MRLVRRLPTTYTFDAAGNQLIENAPSGITTNTWDDENRLVQVRLAKVYPSIGKTSVECPQGDLQLLCQEEVIQSPNPRLRRVEVSVFEASRPERRIIKLVQLVLQE